MQRKSARKSKKCANESIKGHGERNPLSDRNNHKVFKTNEIVQHENGLKDQYKVKVIENVATCSNSMKSPANRLKEAQSLLLNLLASNSSVQSKQDNNISMKGTSSNIKLQLQKLHRTVDEKNFTTSDEEDDYIEYSFRPRQYFLHSICQICKESSQKPLMSCEKCFLTYYCSKQHMDRDAEKHMEFCKVLSTISTRRGGHIMNNTNHLSCEEYRIFRINTLNICEELLQRSLLPYEKEVILYPRLCIKHSCREWRHQLLRNCIKCDQVAYCVAHPDHLEKSHNEWCKPFRLLKEIVSFQEKYGKIDPVLPNKMFTKPLEKISTISQVFGKLYDKLSDIGNVCFYSSLTQIASPPLTIWFTLKLTNLIQKHSLLIHLIGAEHHFEVDALQKWEVFLLHISPLVQQLKIVFVGPELNMSDLSKNALTRNRVCKICRGNGRSINYKFENALYHDYAQGASYEKPDLVCYFNPGLYRATGFNMLDTWPQTIKASVHAKCPVIVTSYTKFENPLDLRSYLNESSRPLSIILPPSINPFRSQRPERNFISEENAPLIYKNFYFFILK